MKKAFPIIATTFGLAWFFGRNKNTEPKSYIEATPQVSGKPTLAHSQLKLPFSLRFINNGNHSVNINITSISATVNNVVVSTLLPNQLGMQNTFLLSSKNTTETPTYNFYFSYSVLLQVLGSSVVDAITQGLYNDFLKSIIISCNCNIDNKNYFIFRSGFGCPSKINATINGLGLVAKNARVIKPKSDYAAYLPDYKPKYEDKVAISDASTEDTGDFIRKVAVAYKSDCAALAKWLQRDSLVDTLRNIWEFVYHHIDYKLDSPEKEQVRRPLRTLYDQKGDCDCYSCLIACILENLNIDYKLKIVDYRGYWQHVYVIVPYTNTGDYYTLDCVLDAFNDEKKPIRKQMLK